MDLISLKPETKINPFSLKLFILDYFYHSNRRITKTVLRARVQLQACTHSHTHTHTYTHTYIYTHMHTLTHTHNIHTYTHIHIYTPIYTHTYTHTAVDARLEDCEFLCFPKIYKLNSLTAWYC